VSSCSINASRLELLLPLPAASPSRLAKRYPGIGPGEWPTNAEFLPVPPLLSIPLCLALAAIVWLSVKLRAGVCGTTLTTSASWGIAVASCWFLAATLSATISQANPSWQDQLWYWTAVLSLVPPIAVLGAKRPGSEAWNFFVLLPLVCVLGWPALTVWSSSGPGALRVESPVLIGFVLVLVMGCGNYVATRLALPALLYALAVVLVLAPCSTATTQLASPATLRTAGMVLMALSVFSARSVIVRGTSQEPGPERVWRDFQELFGIVWMKRAMDRINIEFAEREQWPARLGPDGLEWSAPPTDDQRAATQARLIYSLHWLLRRFVDPEWIETRLTGSEETGQDAR